MMHCKNVLDMDSAFLHPWGTSAQKTVLGMERIISDFALSKYGHNLKKLINNFQIMYFCFKIYKKERYLYLYFRYLRLAFGKIWVVPHHPKIWRKKINIIICTI